MADSAPLREETPAENIVRETLETAATDRKPTIFELDDAAEGAEIAATVAAGMPRKQRTLAEVLGFEDDTADGETAAVDAEIAAALGVMAQFVYDPRDTLSESSKATLADASRALQSARARRAEIIERRSSITT